MIESACDRTKLTTFETWSDIAVAVSIILLKVFEAQKRWQEMGNTPFAGMKYSASGIIRHKRHSWKAGYGKGIARTPKKG